MTMKVFLETSSVLGSYDRICGYTEDIIIAAKSLQVKSIRVGVSIVTVHLAVSEYQHSILELQFESRLLCLQSGSLQTCLGK